MKKEEIFKKIELLDKADEVFRVIEELDHSSQIAVVSIVQILIDTNPFQDYQESCEQP
ncbi:hypothetical protein EUAN_09040 [Andreesenia angusta]|uniref:PARP catalytic domain-containing protein n=1 Tax=Andreesenia angusta TaxID=39480 RepID=A0A1S1V9P1_9FIRM|nr:hypothetical protein EUAN_09040 [Andreesenia angusta]